MKIIKYEDKEYPENLRKIANPPKQLYIEGNEKILNTKSIAIIGSRNCSEYGVKYAKKFREELLKYNLTIISGMAKGIDTIAHKTALERKELTIAVLGGGFNHIFPEENIELYKKIIKSGGAVITEYKPEENISSAKFLQRNRIVCGLAIGTLVIEAEARSGTSVTAKLTKKQEKNVFCIPSSLDNKKGVGTNTLIKQGAKLVTDIEDIIKEYQFLKNVKPKKIKKIKETKNVLSKKQATENKKVKIPKEYQKIYKTLIERPIEINEIIKITKLSASEVISTLTLMEIEGYIKEIEPNKWGKLREKKKMGSGPKQYKMSDLGPDPK